MLKVTYVKFYKIDYWNLSKVIMGNLFGKQRPALTPVSQQDQAILQLKNQRDKMKQYIRRNEKQMEREKDLAKQLIKANKKDRALLILKRKRYQESMTEKMLQQLDQIERMVSDLEFVVIEQRVVEQLRHGNEVLKRMNQMISVDDIERIMDETKEAAEFQEEISNMLSGKLGEDDLEEVEKEFAKLIENEGELDFPEIPSESLFAKIPDKIEERRERVALEAS
uniref:BMA-VPS-20 n=2 Tax=Brugia malayi TaxID=6279 RepID=A0A0J9XPB0_BRUMA|nr:BMA-VPS-20 [Brugia malayi]